MSPWVWLVIGGLALLWIAAHYVDRQPDESWYEDED
jgi:hypothetical protein